MVAENALHRPCVGGSNDWLATGMKQKQNLLLSTDLASVEAMTFMRILLVNHEIDSFLSCPVAASTDTRSVESLRFSNESACSISVVASTDTRSVESLECTRPCSQRRINDARYHGDRCRRVRRLDRRRTLADRCR